jgi:curved DNA-binding protein CbpA
MAQEDYYSLLRVDPQAPEREIKRAYYGLARELHPDRAQDPGEARKNAEKLAVISKAYNTLKDQEKRADYDSKRGKSTSAQRPQAGSPLQNPPPKQAQKKTDKKETRPTTKVSSEATTKLSSNDLASQKILMAQKAFVKGMEFYKNAEYKKSVPFFDAAVQNDPESEPQYHMKLAVCLLKSKGSFNRAVASAEKACEMDQYNMDFKLGLAEIYETVGINSKAEFIYKQILKWEPENEKAMMALANLRGSSKNKGSGILAKIFSSLFNR